MDFLPFDVSRETQERLRTYRELLEKWNRKINLVARGNTTEFWERHFVDSAQLIALTPKNTRRWLDLGSGGGFPGMVVAAIMAEKMPDLYVTCVESDRRKSVFLTTVAREMGIEATVLCRRIEELPNQNADVVSARALAALPQLLTWSKSHLSDGGCCLFLKGAGYKAELEEAYKVFDFQLDAIKSQTNDNARILKIWGLKNGGR